MLLNFFSIVCIKVLFLNNLFIFLYIYKYHILHWYITNTILCMLGRLKIDHFHIIQGSTLYSVNLLTWVSKAKPLITITIWLISLTIPLRALLRVEFRRAVKCNLRLQLS